MCLMCFKHRKLGLWISLTLNKFNYKKITSFLYSFYFLLRLDPQYHRRLLQAYTVDIAGNCCRYVREHSQRQGHPGESRRSWPWATGEGRAGSPGSQVQWPRKVKRGSQNGWTVWGRASGRGVMPSILSNRQGHWRAWWRSPFCSLGPSAFVRGFDLCNRDLSGYCTNVVHRRIRNTYTHDK